MAVTVAVTPLTIAETENVISTQQNLNEHFCIRVSAVLQLATCMLL